MPSHQADIVLESATAAALNCFHGAPPPQKKRKTTHDSSNVLASPIRIRAHSASASDTPYTLVPIAALCRSRVPFSWLSPPSDVDQIRSGSFFSAEIPALEAHGELGIVLAARLLESTDGSIYIVERTKRGIYSLSKLGGWIKESNILVAEKGGLGGTPCQVRTADGEKDEWWMSARVEDPDNAINSSTEEVAEVLFVFGTDGMGNAAKLVSLERSPSSPSAKPLMPLESSQAEFKTTALEAVDGPADSQRSPLELLDILREQYLQILYASKTSVAYFAKGPLARCRAAFQRPNQDGSTLEDLIRFYQSIVLTMKRMDMKYKETLPLIVRNIASTASGDEAVSHKKRKGAKKIPGKSGLYPEEEKSIRKWWKDRSEAEGGSILSSLETETKRLVSELRLRETQLQILLILEAMALELASTGGKCSGDEKTQEGTEKKVKNKRPQDLNVLLELHLDRLCIWHAVGAGEAAAAGLEKRNDSHLPGRKTESDVVRSFCSEVVIPFYASRLPDKCKLITRKFGPNNTSSSYAEKPRSQKATRTAPKPATKLNGWQTSRHSLRRALTDEQSASRLRSSLVRSSSRMTFPDAKRTSMEPLLPTVVSSVRGGIQKAKRPENREVDLSDAIRQHETKLKKVQMLVEQKRELSGAITAIRKPNRELVARDIAADAERRVSGGSSRKQKHPVRNPTGQGVQVMATPKGPRKKNVRGLPSLSKDSARASAEFPTSNSSLGIVPSPAADLKSVPTPDARIHSSGGRGAVQETPLRRPVLEQTPAAISAGVKQTSVSASEGLFQTTQPPAPHSPYLAPFTPLSAPRARTSYSHSSAEQSRWPIVTETPRGKPSSSSATTAIDSSVPATPEKSIYEQLGWEDDDELAL